MTTIDTTAAPAPTKAAPVATRDRIETLDILRGFAVLGILAVNAMSFVWPIALEGSSNGAPFDIGGLNQIATWIVNVFLHDKCRTLFSMLFGVSIFLVGGERSEKARGALLRRRLFFLAVFGLIHGLAFWFGDILLLYAWSGVFMMLARSWPARRLMWVGFALVAAFTALTIVMAVVGSLQAPASTADWNKAVLEDRASFLHTIEVVRSGWAGAMGENLRSWIKIQGLSAVIFVFPTVGLMMLGLGLFKLGYLAGRATDRTYALMLGLGVAIGAVFGWVEWVVIEPGRAPEWANLASTVVGGLAPFMTLAWVALLILMTRHGLGFISRRLAPVGRMAFTNYLTQTIIMSSLFYMPCGPHLYAKVEPGPLLFGVVAAVWLLQLIWSPLWLSKFEMGPLEWVWRCLTYGRRVPLLKQA
ncbi:DUF418 domain-containing protein [soil metagenome]